MTWTLMLLMWAGLLVVLLSIQGILCLIDEVRKEWKRDGKHYGRR